MQSPDFAAIAGAAAKILWPVAAAMLGAWAGARIAFRRFKSERAFDRRIAWHEQMCQILHQARWHLQTGASFDANGNQSGADGEYRQALALADEVSAHSNQAEMYADQSGMDAIDRLMTSLNRWTPDLIPSRADTPLARGQIDARRLASLTMARALGATAKTLAATVRSELGLGVVDYPPWQHADEIGQLESARLGLIPDTPEEQSKGTP